MNIKLNFQNIFKIHNNCDQIVDVDVTFINAVYFPHVLDQVIRNSASRKTYTMTARRTISHQSREGVHIGGTSDLNQGGHRGHGQDSKRSRSRMRIKIRNRIKSRSRSRSMTQAAMRARRWSYSYSESCS